MIDFNVEVAYSDREYETILVSADDPVAAEYEARNIVNDTNPNASNIEVLEVRVA